MIDILWLILGGWEGREMCYFVLGLTRLSVSNFKDLDTCSQDFQITITVVISLANSLRDP